MARRMAHSDEDSLELLLDTICNVFGGIILMAILVVLQTQGSIEKMAAMVASPDTPLEIEQLTFEIERIDKQLADLRKQRQDLDKRFRESASPDTAILLDRREEFVKAIQEAEQRIDKLSKDERKARELLALQVPQESELSREVEAVRRKLEATVKRREQQTDASTITARLPQQHQSRTSGQRIYIVSGNKAYSLDKLYSAVGQYASGDCLVTPKSSLGALFVEPKSGGGTKVPEDPRQAAAFRDLLKRDSADTHLISFFVRANSESFAAFQVVRTVTVAEGYEYSVGPFDGSGVTLFSGSPPAE